MIRKGGCAWVRRKGDIYKGIPAEHCNLMVIAGSDYCPKHLVMQEGAQAETDAKMAKLRARKEFKKQLRESLKDSPLRAASGELDRTYSK